MGAKGLEDGGGADGLAVVFFDRFIYSRGCCPWFSGGLGLVWCPFRRSWRCKRARRAHERVDDLGLTVLLFLLGILGLWGLGRAGRGRGSGSWG